MRNNAYGDNAFVGIIWMPTSDVRVSGAAVLGDGGERRRARGQDPGPLPRAPPPRGPQFLHRFSAARFSGNPSRRADLPARNWNVLMNGWRAFLAMKLSCSSKGSCIFNGSMRYRRAPSETETDSCFRSWKSRDLPRNRQARSRCRLRSHHRKGRARPKS